MLDLIVKIYLLTNDREVTGSNPGDAYVIVKFGASTLYWQEYSQISSSDGGVFAFRTFFDEHFLSF